MLKEHIERMGDHMIDMVRQELEVLELTDNQYIVRIL